MSRAGRAPGPDRHSTGSIHPTHPPGTVCAHDDVSKLFEIIIGGIGTASVFRVKTAESRNERWRDVRHSNQRKVAKVANFAVIEPTRLARDEFLGRNRARIGSHRSLFGGTSAFHSHTRQRKRLKRAGIADLLLTYDRPIHARCNDSVSASLTGSKGLPPLPRLRPTATPVAVRLPRAEPRRRRATQSDVRPRPRGTQVAYSWRLKSDSKP